MEIFAIYGSLRNVDMPVDRQHTHLGRGYAYVEFENPEDAEKALKHMDGGQIDGQEISASAVLAPRQPARRTSPWRGGGGGRGGGGPAPGWRRSPPRYPRRSRSRSPGRRRRSRS